MKHLILPIIFATISAYASENPLIKEGGQLHCSSGSFPVVLEANVYLRKGHYIAELFHTIYGNKTYEAHDGEIQNEVLNWADDVVELELVANDERGVILRQRILSQPIQSLWNSKVKPNHKTKIAVLTVSKTTDKFGSNAKISARVGPIGQSVTDNNLHCW